MSFINTLQKVENVLLYLLHFYCSLFLRVHQIDVYEKAAEENLSMANMHRQM